MKCKFLLSALTCVSLAGAVVPATAQVPAFDPHAIATEAENLQLSSKELSNTIKNMEESILSLTDLGTFSDMLLSLNKLFPEPKPKKSSTLKEVIPIKVDEASDNPAEQAKSAVENLTGGSSSSEEEYKFPDVETVSEAIRNNMQIIEQDENGVCGKGVTNLLGSLGGSVANLGGALSKNMDNKQKATNAIQKRRQANISKQMFSYYALSTGLVNRTMAYRSIEAAKKKAQEKVNKSQTMREVHTAKTASQETLAETYNRLLYSQAVSNAMMAFKSIDHTEGKIAIGFPDPGELTNINSLTDTVTGLIK